MSMIARRGTVIRKKRKKMPPLSPIRTPISPNHIIIREDSESTVFENTKTETISLSPSCTDTRDYVIHAACDDRPLTWGCERLRACSAHTREGSDLCANSASTVYINYHATGITPLPLKAVAIQNENNDRNYFTYEANAKSIDIDDVHHGGSAIVIQIKEVNKEAETSCEFIYKVSTILCNSIPATVCLGVLITIPIAMISIGVKYLNECPKQPKIPVYLLVGGCFGLLFLLVVIWRQIQHRRFESLDGFDDVPGTEGGMEKKSSRATDILLALFHIVWLILGTYWVFGIWKPHFSQLLHDPNNWCDKTIYVFAVFQIMLSYSLFSLAFLVTLGFCICYQVSVIFDEPVR